ncbi:XrtA-associated tyrosine autokinase [Rheinheimera sp. UJ63]|uniref:XrtA-associated tyrosine autokinase n=1 Tax=Rheinheimera sp. UJ63 TaxID=2910157 RepID=UPI001F2B8213|nr:XrtA-associated tyrosine autokinase [Rheinheimera sp. UJ63]MCF4007784.1 XrtA-associated tyrosine autokinase [Rheinheimera sp. UJ63]
MSIIEKAIQRRAEQLDTSETAEQENRVLRVDDISQPSTVFSDDANKKVETSEDRNVTKLDLQRLESQGFVSLSKQRRLINEEYRVIKRKLINNAFGVLSSTLQNSNLILVSSSRPGEGKTFSSINLALSIALEQDKTVLLVDADVLRPKVAKTLGVDYPIGLTDYLLSTEVSVSDIILNTNVPRLKLITAGSPHHLSTELLASDRMLKLAEEFANRYPDRLVIFDAPPLLGVNETSVLAAMCGQAVLVVEENKTRLAEIEQSVSLLPKEIAVGFLINKAHRNQGKGYGYGYYYGAE